ncbi:MBL fold metallo-hydrolase [Pseudonocardia acaciae]|uniref:MBL fold metallo-hydrolase n=1 Tax=Pseudonocardia acaciae TaxID=551276 RepID=UPI0006862274|nr:MBL fold metallo-hydrolase [Pseudonocardia acaciae]
MGLINCCSDAGAGAGRLARRSVLSGVGGLAALAGIAGCAPSGTTPAPAGTTAPSAQPPPRGKLELVLLGTQAGPPIEADRTGIASALIVDGRTYVIDCGRSAATQYLRAGLTLRSLSAIFLTHLHADHIADYYNFFMLGGHIPNTHKDSLAGPIAVYGPGPAGGLPAAFGGGQAPTVAPPAPGTAEMTEKAHEAYAYSTNIFMRDMSIRDPRTLSQVHEIALPEVGASYATTAPPTQPFPVMRDDRVQVTATLVPHGPVFPAFAFRFDTAYGSVTFSGDTAKTDNLITLARGTDILVHEAISVEGANPNPAVLDHMLQSHVLVQELGPIAQKAQAKKLVLSHIGDLVESPINIDKWTNWARQGYDGPVTVGQDLQRFVIA